MKSQLELLREIEDIIAELKGLIDSDLLKAGVSMEQLLNPTEETLRLLRKYRDSLRPEHIETLEI